MNLRFILEMVLSFLVAVFFCDLILRYIQGSSHKGVAIIAGFIAIAYMIYSGPESKKRYERARKENKMLMMLFVEPPIWLLVLVTLSCLFRLREFFGF